MKKSSSFLLVVTFLSLLIVSTSAFASGLAHGPWTMRGHDIQHTGQSQYLGIGFPTLKWRYQTGGDVNSSPAIGSDGTVYVGSDDKYLYAFNPDGTLKWRYQTGGGIASSPAIGSDGTVYVGSGDNYLYAIKPNGTLKWKYFTTNYGVYSSPTIGSDGTVYVGSGDTYYASYLYAINPDGTLKWQVQPSNGLSSSPAIGSDGTVYIGNHNGWGACYLYAIKPDGTLKWKYQTGGYVQSSPAIGSDGTVFVGSDDNYLYAIKPDGTLKWKYQTASYVQSSPAIGSDGTVYVGSYDKYLYAIKPNGTLKWRYQTGGGITSSPAIGSDGTVYIGSDDKYLYAIKLNGQLKYRYLTGGAVSSPPAIGSDGTVYVGSDDYYLYAFGGMPTGKGVIHGYAKDLSTDNGIAGVAVSTTGTNTQTDTDGSYTIILFPGVYDITFSKTGYQTLSINNVVVEEGKVSELNGYFSTSGLLNIVTTILPSAETTVTYSSRVYVNGGTNPYIYALASGSFPPGLTFDPASGNITGTPTTAGSYTFSVGVTDAVQAYAEREFSIEVTEELRIITATPLARGTKGVSYFLSFEANGGTQPFAFTDTIGSLPYGLLVSSNGNLSGTPSTTGSYDFTIQVTDASNRTAEKSFHLEIVNPLIISTTKMNNGIVGTPYNQTMSASGGYGTYQWSVYSGILPKGLSLDSASGVLSGTPTEATYGTVVISVTDQENRIVYEDYALQMADPLQILTTALPNGLKNSPYSEAIRLKGGIGLFTFSATGQLPAGLTLNSTTGIVSGTPTAAGLTNFSVTVTDSTYPITQSKTQNLSIRTVSTLTILTTAVIPQGKFNTTMNPVTLSAAGGLANYQWQIVGGSLPDGISLNSQTGQFSGTPTDKGDFEFTVMVTDANTATAQKDFFWHISGSLSITTGAIPDGAINKSYSFSLAAKGGVLPYQWRIKSGTLPTGLSFNTTTGTIYGTPTTRQTYSFTIEVNDSDSPAQKAEHTYIIDVLDDLYVYTKTVPNGRIGNAYTATFSASLGTPPYQWRLASGVLPPGLTLTSSPTTAVLSGTPTTAGTYIFSLEVSDTGTPVKHVTKEFTIVIYGNVKIDTISLKNALRGVPYSDSIVVSGGAIPYMWQIVGGGLPSGLSLNSTSGNITGIANLVTGQSSTFKVRVTDSGNPSGFDEKDFVIFASDPLVINTDTIQKAMQKSSYQASLQGTGGISPYHWSISSGSLPSGLTLDPDTGVISGKSAPCGIYDFTVQLTDSAPTANSTTRAFQLQVLCCSTCYEISGSTGAPDVLLTLSGNMSATTQSDASGNYSFKNLGSGSYTVTPSKAGFYTEPASRDIAINGLDVSGVNFTLTAAYTISGSVKTSTGLGISGATITFSNNGGTATTDTDGNYSATVPYKNYSGTATISKTGHTFSPATKTYANVTTDKAGENYSGALKGDFNGDEQVNLTDAVISMQILTGITPNATVNPAADVNGDNKIGMPEVIYVLQVTAGLRTP